MRSIQDNFWNCFTWIQGILQQNMKVNIKVFSSDGFKLISGFPLKKGNKEPLSNGETGCSSSHCHSKVWHWEKKYLEIIPFPCYVSPKCFKIISFRPWYCKLTLDSKMHIERQNKTPLKLIGLSGLGFCVVGLFAVLLFNCEVL